MGHLNFDKENGKRRGWKGFALALAVCLVAVGGVAVATFVSSMPKLPKETPETSIAATTTAPTRPVGQNVPNIPDDRTTSTAEESQTSATTASTSSAEADLFILPLTNEVIREYSNDKPVFSPTMNDWRAHNGVDFKGTANQAVKALADGKIVSIEEDILWGNIIVMDHGYGIQSRYCGVKPNSLKKDQTVKVGEIIGNLSEIPCESEDGPHLHLEVLVNNEYVNPIEAIGRDVKYSTSTTSK